MRKLFTFLFITFAIISLYSCNTDEPGTKRCQAITQDGDQCKRNAEKGSNYCWQHKK